MSVGPEIAEPRQPSRSVGTVEWNHRRSTHVAMAPGADFEARGIDLTAPDPRSLNRVDCIYRMEREPTVGACAICGRPLTQGGMPSLSR